MAETVTVLVPADRVARVIGKAGAGLKEVRERSGCKVTVPQSGDPSVGARRVILVGNATSIAAAFAYVLSKAYQEEGCAPTLMIPASKAGQVVGRGGANLRHVREALQVRVSLEREPVVDPTTHTEERMVTMTSMSTSGDVNALSQALRCILSAGPGVSEGGSPMLTMGGKASGGKGGAPPGVVPGAGSVRPAGGDPEEVQVHLVIPDGLAGSILGKAGARVKETEQMAGCRVSVSQRDNSDGGRRVVMVGHAQQVGSAQGIVHEQLQEAAREAGGEIAELTAVLFVRCSQAGAVIGKSGAGLKHVREASGAKVQLARDEVLGQRPCTIVGSFHQVLEAERTVLELLRSSPIEDDNFESSGSKRGSAAMGGPVPTSAYGAYERAGPSAKRARIESSVMTKILVPAEAAGGIIGKQGIGLKRIRESCGVQVETSQQVIAPFPGDRYFNIKGPTQARHSAASMILRIAYGDSDTVTLKLLVPHQLAGAVIGKGGGTLKLIREQCGVGPKVEREDIGGERLVHVTGPQAAVSDAMMIILTSIDGGEIPAPNHAQQAGYAEVTAMGSY